VAETAQLPPLALYVHLPWCVQKCPYCDFNSHTLRGPMGESAYVDALLRDLEWERQDLESRPFSSIFFGGGTPSLFSPEAIARILDAARAGPGLLPGAEITLEANPGTADAANFAGYRQAGVNRLSIGVQSFDDDKLRALGRIHDGQAAVAAFEMARRAGFDNINLDLMFALPQQDMAQARQDLMRAIDLAPEHLSYYHLTLEPNTAFAAAPPPLPDADTGAAMLDAARELLEATGYAGYETSAWAKPGRRCAHNLNYWRFGDYLGIGAGAHGKRSRWHHDALLIERRARQRHPVRYQSSVGSEESLQERRSVAAAERPFEFAMNAMRLHEGFDWRTLALTTGLRPEDLSAPLEKAAALGLIERDAKGVRPSDRGRAHLNGLLELFL
jgi:putative oxygen-independent coproporphyrinogen III oxidase